MAVKQYKSETEIDLAIKELAHKINAHYKLDKTKLTIVVVSKSSIPFYAELAKYVSIDVNLCLISNRVQLITWGAKAISDAQLIENNNVLALTATCTTGRTNTILKRTLYELKAKDVKIASLFSECSTNKPDWHCFESAGRNLFGFGLEGMTGTQPCLRSVYYVED